MENKFKKGLILGGLLATAAAIGLAMTKTEKGKEITKDLQEKFKDLSAIVKERLVEMEDVTKETFEAIVDKVIEEYQEKTQIIAEEKDAIVAALKAKWEEMENGIAKK
ncbi:MAG: hypothetical protein WC926_04410 [Candidatus Paceibacterota bacterium]|jgi:gas vesicle protein